MEPFLPVEGDAVVQLWLFWLAPIVGTLLVGWECRNAWEQAAASADLGQGPQQRLGRLCFASSRTTPCR